ncbi:MAG TPA: hypothetical protein VLS90_10665, partial [Thermodesulfobacteriota bacterium]|nr:hypothetical protein [Thermodesulfobacteriota bacterium]
MSGQSTIPPTRTLPLEGEGKGGGAVPLCHPDERKSCGACCGLYNWEDHSRETLQSLLRAKTSLFHSVGRDPESYARRYAAEALPRSPKLLEVIYNCEFLGFLDAGEKRVGCLLHPAANDGEELRYHCSVYGPVLCAGHLCPSHDHLTAIERESVIASLDDWYLYGLVITDIDLVKEFCRIVQARLGDTIRQEKLRDPAVGRALRDFFQLKERWKFASTKRRLGKYHFSHSE